MKLKADPPLFNPCAVGREIRKCVQPENGPDLDGGVKPVQRTERSSGEPGGQSGGPPSAPSAAGYRERTRCEFKTHSDKKLMETRFTVMPHVE